MESEVTRRAALARFAAMTGSLAAASLLPAAAGAAADTGFDARRQAIFRALVEAYDGEGPIKATGRDLATEMQRRYANGLDDYRVSVDALLDALEVAPSGARFTERSVKGRRQVLLAWMKATEPSDRLLHRARPSDADEPDSLTASNEMNMQAIQASLAKVPEDQKQLDPVTGLVKYQLPDPPRPQLTDGLGATGTPVRLRRQLTYTSYALVASFFLEDTRQLNFEAFA